MIQLQFIHDNQIDVNGKRKRKKTEKKEIVTPIKVWIVWKKKEKKRTSFSLSLFLESTINFNNP